MQTLGDAPLNVCFSRSPNNAHDEEGEPGRGSAIRAATLLYATSSWLDPVHQRS